MDRAYAKQIEELLLQLDDELVTKYYNAFFDISNITTFMRIRQSGHTKESFEDTYLRGGTIDKRTFSEAFELSDESIPVVLAKGEYSAVLAPAFEDFFKTGRLYMMEKAMDDYLLGMLKKHRHDMFGAGAAYELLYSKAERSCCCKDGIDGKAWRNRRRCGSEKS